MVNQISDEFHLNVPKSFYNNPQDLRYFTRDELLVEQIISYFAYGSELGRIEIFAKDLPEYVVGDELKLRTFYIVTIDEAEKVLEYIEETKKDTTSFGGGIYHSDRLGDFGIRYYPIGTMEVN
jgi:hypothetical protein